MNQAPKIYVAGHRGMVGAAIVRTLQSIPQEVAIVRIDPSKAKEKFGWVPEITLDKMVTEMVATDLAGARKHALLKQHGCSVNISVE